jgi:cysteinyl-tRNA synthetase
MLRLKNSLSNSLEPFVPLHPGGRVLLYSCGPTVYSYAHIGNFRSFLLADVLARTLRRAGYEVRHVMNITDVGHMTEDHLADATGEDKLSKAARELGWDPYRVADHFLAAFEADARALGLSNYTGAAATDATLHPRATYYVPEMLALIQKLLDRGWAYVDDEGQVYFSIAAFPEYGCLSGKVLDELEAGSRVGVRGEKRDPRDFALWKVDPRHLMLWNPHGPDGWRDDGFERLRALVPGGVDPRVGRGFPGWHIECSAMSWACLGEAIDVHTGGEDNMFPHHECEIAQTHGALGVSTTSALDGASGPSFSRYWLHGRHLLVDNRKMSKRDGTFFTVRDLLDPRAAGRPDLAERLEAAGFAGGRVPALVLRCALLSSPYTQPMNFTTDLLVQARSTVARLQSCHDRLRETLGEGGADPNEASGEVRARAAAARAAFDAALDDNLDTAGALAALHGFVGDANVHVGTPADAAAALALLDDCDQVFGVLDRRARSGLVPFERLITLAEQGLAVEEPALDPADPAAIERVVAARQKAKRDKDFARADALRQQLRGVGVTIEDTAGGVRWKRG